MTDPTSYDVAIIGGGPAGMAAAEQTLRAGLSTCVIDEQPRLGGQILRQPPESFRVPDWLAGRIYRPARALLERTEVGAGLDFRLGHAVLGLAVQAGGEAVFRLSLHALAQGGLEAIKARRVVIAGGCYDMPVAFPGWTLPGVMSAGAAQTLIKSQQVVPGQRFALFGTHPLMIVLACQILAAGGDVVGVHFAQTHKAMLRVSLHAMPGVLATPAPILEGLSGFVALRKARVPVRFGWGIERAHGDGALAALDFAGAKGGARVACDAAAMCFGFLPQSDLVRQAGADVRWAPGAGGWAARCDASLRTSIEGLYVAGETAGVAGSDVAMARGALAGIVLAGDLGALGAGQVEALSRKLRRRLARLSRFAAMLHDMADPTSYLPEPAPSTLLCRCEDIRVEDVDAAIAQCAAAGSGFGASAVKLRCRAGMGLCQGRSCEHAVMRRMARAGMAEMDAIAGFTARYPARSATISELLADR